MKRNLILEQSSRIDLKKALDSGCFATYKWIKPESIQLARLTDGRDVITAENIDGHPIGFFNDFSVINNKTKKQAKWFCELKDETLLGKAKMTPLTPTDIINKY